MIRLLGYCLYSVLLIGTLVRCTATTEDEGPSPPLTPEKEHETFQLEPGLSIELVASEPMVQDPVVITFDEHNRMWVVEMRGFMPDIEGHGETDPVGRISVLEDTDGDGVMDKSTVYLDSLILPRALALIPRGALVVENKALWMTEDTDGDLKADTKVMVDPDYAGSALPEHAGNGLLRALDNWYYNAKSRFRYQLRNGKWLRDSTEFRGQWGISQDNTGRLYYNYNWSQLHADLVPPNYIGRNKHHTPTSGIDHGLTIDRRIYPVRSNPAVNRGYIPGTLNNEGKLVEFTAACSPFYYRGKALPDSFYGNVFVCEPAGNLVKRNVVTQRGVFLSASDPHPGREFLASGDERFRPVFITSGPDGALYIADMYRGLVQHGAYVTPYLKDQTLKRKLANPVHLGRIWRIVPKGWKRKNLSDMAHESSAGLVGLLSHPDGWHRDMAQRLLIERGDTSAIQQLTKAIITGSDVISRNQALWTLEGLAGADSNLLFTLLRDKEELIRITAMRLLEKRVRDNSVLNKKMLDEMTRLESSAPITEILQMTLSSNVLRDGSSLPLLSTIASKYDTSQLIRDALLSSLQDKELKFLQILDKLPSWNTQTPGKEILLETLTTAIVKSGNANEVSRLLARVGNMQNRRGWKEATILNGMAIQGRVRSLHPIRLASEPAIFRHPLPSDTAKLNLISGMFEWPGHKPASVKNNRAELSPEDQKQFALGRQHYLTTCAGCHGTNGEGLPRFAPPLTGSDWVLGNEKRLALIILQGMEGQIDVNGKKYGAPDILPVMPSLSTMDDGAITAIMTYVRNEWGNSAPAVTRNLVGKTRHTHQGRVQPWTPVELNEFISKNPDVPTLK